MKKVNDKLKLTVEFDNINYADTIALMQMFKLYESFGKMGHSGCIGYYVDGDGAFRPHVTFKTSKPIQSIENNHALIELKEPVKLTNYFDSDGVWVDIEKALKDIEDK